MTGRAAVNKNKILFTGQMNHPENAAAAISPLCVAVRLRGI